MTNYDDENYTEKMLASFRRPASLKSLQAPDGTSGLAVEPWLKGEIYAVAADWSQAAGQVWSYGEDGWIPTGQQVADYRHHACAALAREISEALVMSGEEDDEDEVSDIVSRAVEI